MKFSGLQSSYSRRDLYGILFRHKWKIIICFILIMGTAIVATVGTLRVYQADAKLLIRIGRESVTLDPTANTGPMIGVGHSRENEINSELEILKSWDLAEQVMKSIGAEYFLEPPKDPPPGALYLFCRNLLKLKDQVTGLIPRLLYYSDSETTAKLRRLEKKISEAPNKNGKDEAATIALRGGLKISVQKNSNILNLTYEGSSPAFSREVLAKLIDLYMEKHINIYRTSGSYPFFDQQTETLRQQLAGSEDELRKLKNKTGVASVDDNRKILLSRISSAQQQLETTQAGLAASTARMENLNKQLAQFPEFILTGENEGTSYYGADTIRGRLFELQLKEQELLSKYSENNVLVKEIRRQIEEARKLHAREKQDPQQVKSVTKGINTIHQSLNMALQTEKVDFASLEAKREVLQDQLRATRRELEDLNNTEVRMINLQRELSLGDAKYRKYSENLEQARIDQALEKTKISNITVVQPAVAYSDPIRPRPVLNIILGLFLSLLFGTGVAFSAEFFSHSIKTPQDVEERLQLPMLASIPALKRSK